MQLGQDRLPTPMGQMDHLGEACPPNPTMEIAQYTVCEFFCFNNHACKYLPVHIEWNSKLIPKLFKDFAISAPKFFVTFYCSIEFELGILLERKQIECSPCNVTN